jgi:hypothetical protein
MVCTPRVGPRDRLLLILRVHEAQDAANQDRLVLRVGVPASRYEVLEPLTDRAIEAMATRQWALTSPPACATLRLLARRESISKR